MSRRNSEKGVTAIEFALVLPIVLVIMFGIFEFGLALWRKQELTSAVREGARKGVVATSPRKTKTEIETAVKTYMTGVGLTDSGRTAVCSGTCPCTASGQTLTVTATYPTKFGVLSRLSKLLTTSHKSAVAATRTISATVSMQCE